MEDGQVPERPKASVQTLQHPLQHQSANGEQAEALDAQNPDSRDGFASGADEVQRHKVDKIIEAPEDIDPALLDAACKDMMQYYAGTDPKDYLLTEQLETQLARDTNAALNRCGVAIPGS